MAKKKTGEATSSDTPTKKSPGEGVKAGGSIASYFSQLLTSRPDLLKIRDNEEALAIWLSDHPEETVVPKNVVQGLANAKSKLRKNKKSRKSTRIAKVEAHSNGEYHRPSAKTSTGLVHLEQLIDNCLHIARDAERDDFEQVIYHLRYARNQIIKKLDQ